VSAWHREHPELVGTDADPWMIHESYRKALPPAALLEQQPEWIHESTEECEFEKRAHEDQAWDDELDGAKRYEGDRW
jgi:hypothetical protein